MRVRLLGYYFRWFNISILFIFSIGLSSQQIIVLDDEDKPLEAVWIYNQRDKNSVFTDENGQAEILDIQIDDKLIFEHLGFRTIHLSTQNLKQLDFIIRMKRVSEVLDEITVVGRTDATSQEIFNETTLISKKSFLLNNAQTTADAMSKNGALFIQKSQMGGGSPVMRGFEANRLLLVVDGIKMNNAIYRNGHLHNAITVDAMSLNNIELIFGPGSLAYGSDALGGVIHFRTKDPVFNFDKKRKYTQQINYNLRYSTANKEKAIHLSMKNSWRNIAFLSGVTLSKYGDLRSGSRRPESYPEFGKRYQYVDRSEEGDLLLTNANPNIQIGTAYSQLDFFQKASLKIGSKLKLSTNLQFSASSNVPRYDQLTELNDAGGLKYADWYYGPQNRFLGAARLDYKSVQAVFDKLIVIASSQRIDEDRFSRKFNDKQLESTREDIWVHGITVDLIKNLNLNHKFNYGLDLQSNLLQSQGFGKDILTGSEETNVLSRYPDKSADLINYGAFLNYTMEQAHFHLQTGIRYTGNRIKIAYQEASPIKWPEHFYTGIENNNAALAYSLGLKYIPGLKTEFKLYLSSAFRTPNIDDLAKIRVKNGEILIPNPDLKPENAYSADLSVKQKLEWSDLEQYLQLNGFYTMLFDGIIRDAFLLPDGSDVYYDGVDSLSVVANVNAERLIIYGFYIGLNGKVSQNIRYGGKVNYTHGRVIESGNNRPAGHIPPVFGSVWASWEKSKWLIKFSVLFNGSKSLEHYGGSVDNPEYATADGSYSWSSFSIHSRYEINDKIQLSFGLENILDKHYRPFASGVSAPGINAIISLQGRI